MKLNNMKYVLTTLIMFGMFGCGVTENMARNCGGDQFCIFIFGSDVADGEAKDREQDKKIKDFYMQLGAVQSQQATLLQMLGTLTTMLSDTNDDVEDLRQDVAALVTGVTTLQNSMVNGYYTKQMIDGFISTINGKITDMLSDLAVLQGYNTVTQIVAPCGVKSGHYEVLLRTSDGHILAYFESGGQRYLSSLVTGQPYTTTDGHNCTFTIQPGGNISGSTSL